MMKLAIHYCKLNIVRFIRTHDVKQGLSSLLELSTLSFFSHNSII